jgi:predicted N-acetyltransferase YhbS
VDQFSQEVVGFYWLTMGQVVRSGLPRAYGRGLPDLPIGMVLLARLAISGAAQGEGHGRDLLVDAIVQAAQAGEHAEARFIAADPIDEGARTFYNKFDFKDAPGDEGGCMYLRLKDAIDALELWQRTDLRNTWATLALMAGQGRTAPEGGSAVNPSTVDQHDHGRLQPYHAGMQSSGASGSREEETMTNESKPKTKAVAKISADTYAPLPEDCLRCGGPIGAEGLGLKVFKESKELGSVCHDCTWDGNGHAILTEDELEGWLRAVG